MNKPVILAIDELVNEIYSPDQAYLIEKFTALVDQLIQFIDEMQKMDYLVDLTKELNILQSAFEKKDYVALADELLYDLKPQFEELDV